jgi:hypothetical protein
MYFVGLKMYFVGVSDGLHKKSRQGLPAGIMHKNSRLEPLAGIMHKSCRDRPPAGIVNVFLFFVFTWKSNLVEKKMHF